MADTHDGGKAFPVAGGYSPAQSGMSLRDYFAAKAMTIVRIPLPSTTDDALIQTLLDAHAKTYYRLADAMLKAREGR